MEIKYANLIDTVVSPEGSNGFLTNHIYYTVLIVYMDGSKKIVTQENIGLLAPYIRTPMDEIFELQETLREMRGELKNQLLDMVEKKTEYIIDSLYPIPDIINIKETDAIAQLEDAGLIPVYDVQYPQNTPPNGIVRAYGRNGESFKKVNVRIIHDVPDIMGLKESDALAELRKAGFTANVSHQAVTGQENGIVLHCNRDDETKLNVDLLVSRAVPETRGMNGEAARKLLQSEGYEVTIQKQVRSANPGTVINWISIGDKSIKLYVSIPQTIKAKSVSVDWTNMQDSSGDYYAAVAEFDNKSSIITIKLSYTIGIKTKHQITGIRSNANSTPSIPLAILVPNDNGTLKVSVSCPCEGSIAKLPTSLTLFLDTQYGLIKKNDTTTLNFVFDWPEVDLQMLN